MLELPFSRRRWHQQQRERSSSTAGPSDRRTIHSSMARRAGRRSIASDAAGLRNRQLVSPMRERSCTSGNEGCVKELKAQAEMILHRRLPPVARDAWAIPCLCDNRHPARAMAEPGASAGCILGMV
jgi:hypothetical protein